MNASEKKRIIGKYVAWFEKYGASEKALGWIKGRQALRFDVLLSHWNVRGKSVLDFGCGFGDMYQFLKKRGIDARYEGVDINPILIAEGTKRYPQAVLGVRDALLDGLPRRYDFIFSSGVHNFKLKDNRAFIRDTMDLFHRHAKTGFAMNFLSTPVDYSQPDAYYADPADILRLARSYSRRVLLRHDYMPFEFTVFVDKRNKFSRRYPVYR